MSQPPPPPLPSPAPERRKIPRWIKWGAVGCPGLLGLAWVITYLTAVSRLNEAVEAVSRDGFALQVDALVPPPAPEADNGVEPLLQALDRVPRFESAKSFYERIAGRLDWLKAEKRDGVLEQMRKFEGLFQLLDRAAAFKRIRFNADEFRDDAARREVVVKTSYLVGILAARIELEAREGRVDGALRALDHMMLLAEACRGESYLDVYKLRLRILGGAARAVNRSVTAKSSVEELREWRKRIPGPEILDGSLEPVARRFLAMTVSTFGSAEFRESEGYSALDRTLFLPLWILSAARHVDRERRGMLALTHPYAAARREILPIDEEFSEGGMLNRITRGYGLKPGELLWPHVEAKVRLAIVREGLRYEIQRAEKGAYPGEVETLDPYNGLPLSLRPTDGILFSAAWPTRDAVSIPGRAWRLCRYRKRKSKVPSSPPPPPPGAPR